MAAQSAGGAATESSTATESAGGTATESAGGTAARSSGGAAAAALAEEKERLAALATQLADLERELGAAAAGEAAKHAAAAADLRKAVAETPLTTDPAAAARTALREKRATLRERVALLDASRAARANEPPSLSLRARCRNLGRLAGLRGTQRGAGVFLDTPVDVLVEFGPTRVTLARRIGPREIQSMRACSLDTAGESDRSRTIA